MDLISPAELVAYAALGFLLALMIYLLRSITLRGVPDLSAEAVGVLRIAYGVVLIGALKRLGLPDQQLGPGAEAEAALWAPWGWVEYLAGHWNVRDTLLAATYVAVAAFTLGVFTRLAYVAVCVGLVVRLLVAQEYGLGSHAWMVLPVALVPTVSCRGVTL